MIGPTSADPALQVRAIEDLIAKGVDVIGVVPNDEAAVREVLAFLESTKDAPKAAVERRSGARILLPMKEQTTGRRRQRAAWENFLWIVSGSSSKTPR